MVLVDAGDIDGIDLYDHVPLYGFFDALHLLGEEDFCAFEAGIALALVIDELVDLGADLGIDRIECNGDIADIIFFEQVYLVGQEETISADAFDHVGIFFVKAAEGFKGLFVCQRFAGPGNADDLDVVVLLHDFLDHVHGFIGIQYPRGDPGTALVHAVKIPDAVIALDIAFGRHGYVAPAEGVACFFGKTGMFIYFAHLRCIPLDFFSRNICDLHLISHNQHHYVCSVGINTVQS